MPAKHTKNTKQVWKESQTCLKHVVEVMIMYSLSALYLERHNLSAFRWFCHISGCGVWGLRSILYYMTANDENTYKIPMKMPTFFIFNHSALWEGRVGLKDDITILVILPDILSPTKETYSITICKQSNNFCVTKILWFCYLLCNIIVDLSH